MFNKFDSNSSYNNFHTIIQVNQNIDETLKRILDLCKNFLAMQCERLIDEPNTPLVLIVHGVRYKCKRVCDLTGNTLEFVMEFLTTDEESVSIVKCTHWHGENSHMFFEKTMDTLRFVIESVSDYEDHFIDDCVVVLHPNESKLVHTMKQNTCVDPVAYSECHPGLNKMLTIEQVHKQWELITNFFSFEEKLGLSTVTNLALKGTPVPLNIYDTVLSCDVTIELIICLIAIVTCNPLIPYETLKVNYPFDERLQRIMSEASQKDEFCKRQVVRLMYALKIRGVDNCIIDITTDFLITKRVLDSVM